MESWCDATVAIATVRVGLSSVAATLASDLSDSTSLLHQVTIGLSMAADAIGHLSSQLRT